MESLPQVGIAVTHADGSVGTVVDVHFRHRRDPSKVDEDSNYPRDLPTLVRVSWSEGPQTRQINRHGCGVASYELGELE
jgi:hypothetical protein